MRNGKEVVSRLMEFAGKHRYLTLTACVLSGVSAVLALCPFICIWLVVRRVFEALPDVSTAQGLGRYGWMAVAFAVGSMIVYFAALMCSHLAAFRVARNMKSRVLRHIVTLPLGFFNSSTSGKLRKIIDEGAGQTEGFLAHRDGPLLLHRCPSSGERPGGWLLSFGCGRTGTTAGLLPGSCPQENRESGARSLVLVVTTDRSNLINLAGDTAVPGRRYTFGARLDHPPCCGPGFLRYRRY